jgi:hypothetical protein
MASSGRARLDPTRLLPIHILVLIYLNGHGIQPRLRGKSPDSEWGCGVMIAPQGFSGNRCVPHRVSCKVSSSWASTITLPTGRDIPSRGAGEIIHAALLSADLPDFTALSEATEPAAVIAALDAWFNRIVGGGARFRRRGAEVHRRRSAGDLPSYRGAGRGLRGRAARGHRRPRSSPPAPGWRISTQCGRFRGCRRCPSARHFIWARFCGAISAPPTRLDVTAIGPAVNLVSRLEGLCRPLGRSVLISGAVAAETTTPLVPLGEHALRGIAASCAVFTLQDA